MVAQKSNIVYININKLKTTLILVSRVEFFRCVH